MNKSIVIYSDSIDTIMKLVSKDFGVYIVDDEDSVKEMLNLNHKFKIFIIDSKKILESETNIFKSLKVDKIFQELPIIAYSKSDTYGEKNRLYSLGINGIINKESDAEYLSNLINRIALKANPDIGSKKDRFIKSLILYEGFEESVEDAIYLAEYLIVKYKLTSAELDIVKDSVSLLVIAYKKNNFNAIIKFMETMEVSSTLSEKMLHYNKLETLIDNIIYLVLLMNSDAFTLNIKNLVDFDTLDKDVYTVVQEASKNKNIFIDNHTDIYRFWNIINTIMLQDNEFTIEESEEFLKYILAILNKALVKRGGLEAHLETNHIDYLLVNFKPYNCTMEKILECMKNEVINNEYIEISYDKGTKENDFSIRIKLNAQSKQETKTQVPLFTVKEQSVNAKATSKITAKAYCEDIEIDTDLLDDLDEISETTLDIIAVNDGITDAVLEVSINALSKYIRLFNQSIEFEHIAEGFMLLKSALENCSLENIDSLQQESINSFLSSVFHDVSMWKNHIYVTQDAPDIHYVDDSLVSNCIAIAGMLNATEAEDNEDDLEFF